MHLLLGLAGVIASRHWTSARAFLIAGGIAYLGLLVYGLIVEQDHDANFVPLNDADNWLHLGLGASMLLIGLTLRPHEPRYDDARYDDMAHR